MGQSNPPDNSNSWWIYQLAKDKNIVHAVLGKAINTTEAQFKGCCCLASVSQKATTRNKSCTQNIHLSSGRGFLRNCRSWPPKADLAAANVQPSVANLLQGCIHCLLWQSCSTSVPMGKTKRMEWYIPELMCYGSRVHQIFDTGWVVQFSSKGAKFA